jgi:hypothetical protein
VTDTQITVPEIVVRIPAHNVIGVIAAAPDVPAAAAVTTPADRERDAAGDRNDFIKRLFAVAISVGFANHIDQLKWMATLSSPDQKTAQYSALLLVAVLTTVLSWEGYLTSLRDRPLLDRTRFFIDIVIVFEYLIPLTLYESPPNFALWVCVIFTTYVSWDYVRILMTTYDNSSEEINRYKHKIFQKYNLPRFLAPIWPIWPASREINRYKAKNWFTSIYPLVVGLFSHHHNDAEANRDLYKGPSITFLWLIYFIVLTTVVEFNGIMKFWASILLSDTA